MNGRRSAWIAARARNAARRGGWIAGIGGVSTVLTLLAFVMVPRELDRQLRRRIDALPAAADSLPIARRLDRLRTLQRDTLVIIDSALLNAASVLSARDTAFAPPMRGASPADSGVTRLTILIERARSVPLPDSYRALAESPLMREDARVASRVAVLVDSIDRVDREREAHAALGGPGARYAALTSRLTALGQGLIRIAEQRLAQADAARLRDPGHSADARPDSGTMASAMARLADSARRATADSMARLVAREESLLVEARRSATERDARRAALEQRLNVEVPPLAMLAAALVVGMAVGYGAVFVRELRWPTVSDVSEVERLTGAQVLAHSRSTPVAPASRAGRRERPFVPPIVDRDSDTFVLLHLALSGVGEAVSQVDVLADDPVLAAAVAMSTAAAATRESRAVLVVESATRRPLLAHLLRTSPAHTSADVLAGRVSPDDAVHVVTLDRDTHIDTMVTGPLPAEAMQRLEARYDLRLYLTDPATGSSPARDVVLCVRQGATPLAWLSRITQHLRRRQQRVRAVVVWSRDVPTAS